MGQLLEMYSHLMEERWEDYKFQAAMQGHDLDKATKKQKTGEQTGTVDNSVVPMFGDPEEYKKLTKDQREKMTQDMMGKHKHWVENKDKVSR